MADRLKREDWTNFGLDVLRDSGHEKLKAEPMARALGVSRGSFYWHFPSIQDFHAAVLQAWRAQITEAVIADLKELPKEHDQLRSLMARTLETDQTLEVAMRRWGGVDPSVARAIEEVDQLRADYLTALFRAQGLSDAVAKSRAALLTWAFVGRAFAPQMTTTFTAHTVEDLSALLLSQPVQIKP